MIVLDASALVEILLNTEPGVRLAARLRSTSSSLHAPHLIDLEVAQALRRFVLSGDVEEDRARVALTHLNQLDLNRYPHSDFLPRIWALRHNLTAYDAAYVALTEALGATLVTGDRALAQTPGVQAQIETI